MQMYSKKYVYAILIVSSIIKALVQVQLLLKFSDGKYLLLFENYFFLNMLGKEKTR